MYIIAIAWIYVVLLMSFTEDSIVAGIATFLLYGLAPLSLLLYLMGTPQRRRNRRRREALNRESEQLAAEAEPTADESKAAAVPGVVEPPASVAAGPSADRS